MNNESSKTLENVNDSPVKAQVCSFENLYKALRHCRRGVMWKDSVARYSLAGPLNVYYLSQDLKNNTYHLGEYFKFKVYEPKERDIVSTRIRDRVFEHSFNVNYFYPQMTKSFIYDNVACQNGKGNEMGRKRLRRHMQHYYRRYDTNGWVLKVDIKSFFASIDHDIAIQTINNRLDDLWARKVGEMVVRSFGTKEFPHTGLGLGSELTQIIALAILDPLDHIIKEKLHIKYYIRYMDDLILIHHEKQYLKQCLKKIVLWLKEHKFNINQNKTQIFPLSQGITFLGFCFRLTDTGKILMTLPHQKISHERRKLMRLVKRVKQGIMTKDQVDHCKEAWFAYVGNHHARGTKYSKAHRSTNNLIRKIDKFYNSLWEDIGLCLNIKMLGSS